MNEYPIKILKRECIALSIDIIKMKREGFDAEREKAKAVELERGIACLKNSKG